MKNIIKKFKKITTTRFMWLCILIILQIVLFMTMASIFSGRFSLTLEVLSLVIAVWIVNDKVTDTHKLAWVVPILAFPLIGGLFYLIFGRQKVPNKKNIRFLKLKNELIINNKKETPQQIAELQKFVRITNFLEGYSFNRFTNTKTKYFGEAEEAFTEMLRALKTAQKYIFLEFFIVNFGYMWNEILDILKERAAAGVEVRLIYDDIGCIDRLPAKYFMELKKSGILCIVFNKASLFLNSYLNSRDHRKIVVIDGKVGFVGGFNISDEYINKLPRFGHWKDSGVYLEGEAVQSLTAMFLQMWNYDKKYDSNLKKYFNLEQTCENTVDNGLVQPFCSGPCSYQRLYEYVYLNLIYNAQKEVILFTPYFVPSGEFLDACKMASQGGISVKIVYPKINDKWYINLLSRSYFKQLIEENVEIYEYLPGFIHAKSMLVDGIVGVVGSANIDYRSFYSQFEVGVFMYNTQAIAELKTDCNNTLQQCHRITLEECVRPKRLGVRFLASLFRLFRPLF